jgi:cell division protein FtsQ
MNKVLKYVLLSLSGALIVACMICMVLLGRAQRGQIICKNIQVHVQDSADIRFISSDEIKRSIIREYGRCIGTVLDSIDLVRIEDIVDRKSAVLKSQAYTTKDSTLHIDVTQRKPIVRFQQGGSGFYADSDGYVFPLQSTYAPHIQIVDGNIPVKIAQGHKGQVEDLKSRQWLMDMIEMVKFIENDKDWKKLIVQIHVNEDKDLVMVPREGHEKFIFGYPDHFEEKFGKFRKYYTAIIPKAGKDRYKVVDLRFNGQIVCK